MGEGTRSWAHGWRGAVLIAAGIFIGAMAITPAVARVTSSISDIIKQTDKRYYKKSQSNGLFQRKTPLRSGESISGVFSAGADSGSVNGYLGVGIDYPRPLATPLPDANLVDVRDTGSGLSAPHCPGIGQADPGFLCLYNSIVNSVDTGYMYSEEDDVNGKIGAVLYFHITGADPFVGGTWTLTAP